MYAPFFGLDREPFSISPDPRFLYLSERHREALAHLLYGLSAGGGFVLLTGDIGAGKTTICRGFLEQVPAHCKVAYIFNPKLTVPELLSTVCQEFGVVVPTPDATTPSAKDHVDALNQFLLQGHARGEQAVLVIDEAQGLNVKLLEQLRLLTNLETAERKLLQIILIGQPELRDLLAQPELKQLAQRVIARYHLQALAIDETPKYIQHRLAVAGPHAASPFDAELLRRIHTLSDGVPRRINLLADRALLGAYAQGKHRVDRETVDQAAREVFGDAHNSSAPGKSGRLGSRSGLLQAVGGGVLLVLLLASIAWLVWRPWSGSESAQVHVTAAAAARAAADASTLAVAAAQGPPSAASRPAAAELGVVTAPAVAASVAATTTITTASTGAPVLTVASAAALSPKRVFSADATAVLAAAHPQSGTAWRELALHWNVAVGEGDPCAAVRQAQLACWRGAGVGLPLLRQLSRPGVLVLRDSQGRSVYALLVALDTSHAVLQVGAQQFGLTLAALAQAWRGEFYTLWRTPEPWRDGPDSNTQPALRAWALQRGVGSNQAASEGAAAAPTAAVFGEQLRVYQLAQGLPADGRLGPVTLMHLSRLSGVSEPWLAAVGER